MATLPKRGDTKVEVIILSQLIINSTYEKMIPALTAKEYDSLKDSIKNKTILQGNVLEKLQEIPLMANNKSSILQELTLHRNLLRDEIEKLDVRIIYLNNLKTSLRTSYKETSSAIASLEDS